MTTETIIEIRTKNKKDKGFTPTSPRGTFIPINDAIIVGMEITSVIEVKNFITSFKLLEITVP